MPTLRQSLLASVTRRYPLMSGNVRVANHRLLRKLDGRTDDQAWVPVKSGYQMLVPLNDTLGRTIYYMGEIDAKLTWICERLIRPGDTVLDIGAHMGIVTLTMASLVGPTGRVHAFEPNPRLLELLQSSVAKNGITNVTVHPIALGSEDGELTLMVPEGHAGMGSLVRQTDQKNRPMASYTVPVRTLSSVLQENNVGPVRLIKIDVEGFEAEVLKGAQSAFVTHPADAIVFELLDPTPKLSDHPTISTLRELDYDFFSIPRALVRLHLKPLNPDDPAESAAFGDHSVSNFLAVRRGKPYDEIARLVS